MESLAFLFAVGVVVAIVSPRKRPPPKNAWVKLGDAVEGVLKDILKKEVCDEILRDREEPPPKSNDLFWVILFSALIGVLVLFGG